MSLTEYNLQTLREHGFSFDGGENILSDNSLIKNDRLAMDAVPSLTTTPNAGIPAFMNTVIDPNLIEVAFAPMRGAEVAGEMKKGSWETSTAIFEMFEATGEVGPYGDYNNNGSSGANYSFPERQAYTYETFIRWGEMELLRLDGARINHMAKLRGSAALRLNKYQNQTYFYGVQGMKNYGFFNDPNLSPSITASVKSNGKTQWQSSDPEAIQKDCVDLIGELRRNSGGLVDTNTPMTFVMSPESMGKLTYTNSFGKSAHEMLTSTYPNLRFVQAPEAGDLASNKANIVMVLADSIDGQPTATAAFTEKLRAHNVIQGASSWSQKYSQGSFGAIIFLPYAVATMVGV